MNTLRQAVEILKQGGIVVYPTDTAYGLAVDATNTTAVKKLYRLKGRGFRQPVHVIPPTKVWLHRLVKLDSRAKKLIEALMPGPLTLVLPLKISGPGWKILSGGTKTLGIRRPKNNMALDLAMLLGRPITTTSANLRGGRNTYSVAAAKRQFRKSHTKPDFYLDGGRLQRTKPSTFVLLTPGHVKILRPGPITETQIKNVLLQPPR